MPHIPTEIVIMVICGVVIISYLFTIVSNIIKVPSVLLLLISGITLRQVADYQHWGITMPEKLIEFFGTVGLVMIVLEAGLDLNWGVVK